MTQSRPAKFSVFHGLTLSISLSISSHWPWQCFSYSTHIRSTLTLVPPNFAPRCLRPDCFIKNLKKRCQFNSGLNIVASNKIRAVWRIRLLYINETKSETKSMFKNEQYLSQFLNTITHIRHKYKHEIKLDSERRWLLETNKPTMDLLH